MVKVPVRRAGLCCLAGEGLGLATCVVDFKMLYTKKTSMAYWAYSKQNSTRVNSRDGRTSLADIVLLPAPGKGTLSST